MLQVIGLLLVGLFAIRIFSKKARRPPRDSKFFKKKF